ncbi:MAG: hypothetical protein NC115_10515 [Bacteroidales bacterium]|nr:hypothetical protein [Bacteroidales bacterium]
MYCNTVISTGEIKALVNLARNGDDGKIEEAEEDFTERCEPGTVMHTETLAPARRRSFCCRRQRAASAAMNTGNTEHICRILLC